MTTTEQPPSSPGAAPAAPDLRMFIDGAAAESISGEWTHVRSPATGELVGRVPAGTERDVDRAVTAARAAFRDGRWHRMLLADRVAVLFGHVQINDHLVVTSEMPHGFKQSGFGKDMSTYSFEEYTQVKHVMLELTGQPEKGWHYTIFGDKAGA